MEPAPATPKDFGVNKTVAAIDVGSNALRMVIAEVLPDGRIETLERLHRAVRLGQDTFRRGRLGAQSMRAAVAILKDFRQLLRVFQVERVRAVATSAVREASNADTFLDRVLMATGVRIEVIDPSEESRLTVAAVRQTPGGMPPADGREMLIAMVGGGSTLLTILEGNEIVASQSVRLGSIRLQEVLSTSGEPPQRSAEMLRSQITNMVASVAGSLPLGDIASFMGVGGDAAFVARQIAQAAGSQDLLRVSVPDFDELVEQCEKHTAEELSKRFGLPFADAETLNPALLIYQTLLRRTRAQEMIISHATMGDGLLLDLAREATGGQDESLVASVVHSAESIAAKYHADMDHARNVADVAARLFDELHGDHGLGPRHRLLLRVAGLLHEIGGYVSNRAHHKHSEYLIANSEIFGLSRSEITLVAEVARYHRRSTPRSSHPVYMALPRESRVAVNKLAAMLRVADALVRGQGRRARDYRFLRKGEELIVSQPGGGDLLLEKRALAVKGDLFEETFGMKVHLEEG